jgi:hypothetical protein
LDSNPKTSKLVKISPKTAKEAKNFYDEYPTDLFLGFLKYTKNTKSTNQK